MKALIGVLLLGATLAIGGCRGSLPLTSTLESSHAGGASHSSIGNLSEAVAAISGDGAPGGGEGGAR